MYIVFVETADRVVKLALLSSPGDIFGIFIVLAVIGLGVLVRPYAKRAINRLKHEDDATAAKASAQERTVTGGIMLSIGLLSAIYGIYSVNSAQSQISGWFGETDRIGIIAIVIGVLCSVVGVVMLFTRETALSQPQTTTGRKCPFCAETIQAEAKICRFCNRDM